MRIPRLRGLLESNLLLAAVALAAGVLAAWLGSRQLAQRAADIEQQAKSRYATAQYIVASRDVARGESIEAKLLSIRTMPRAFAPADALAPDAASLLIGGRAAIAIRRGSPVVQAALLREPTRERLSESLPDGKRALTIQVDQLNAISGHLEAGDNVDLYYSRPRGNGAVLVPLMQRVQVLATGDVTQMQLESRAGDQQDIDFSSVTLLVSAADAERVVLAEQTGRLTLLLRRPTDDGLRDARALDSAELLKSARASTHRDPQHSLPVELLVGGNGVAPARSWLSTGEGA